MAKKTDFIRPKFTKIKEEERDLLIGLRDSVSWDVLRRVVSRYVAEIKDRNFAIPHTDEKLAEKHAEAIGQAFGMQKVINLVEGIKEPK